MFNETEITRLLTAIGDSSRLKIMFLLGTHDRLNVGEIAGNFQISRPTVSHHLKVLKDAGVVCSEKAGQETYYWLARDQVVSQLHLLADEVAKCNRSTD